MQLNNPQIHNLLWKEVAAKSRAASFGFAACAAIVFFYYFNLPLVKTWIQSASVAIILANIVRFSVSLKVLEKDAPSASDRRILTVLIWINALLWSFVFGLGLFLIPKYTYSYTILMTIVVGFLASSILTLGYSGTIFYPFLILIMGPVMTITGWQYLSGINPEAIYLLIFFTVLLIYLVKQYHEYRGQLLERFRDQLELETSNREIKRAQEELLNKTVQLMHASRISGLGEMAAGLSHEINNSLMVILASIQMIRRELVKNHVSESVKTKIDQSEKSIEKIKSVVEGLKYFSSQMDSGPKKATELKNLIDTTFSYTGEILKVHEIDLKVDPIPEVSLVVHPFQIVNVLFNIIRNADDHLTKLPVQDRWIKLSFHQDTECLCIKLTNGGPKISQENQLKLFQPFFTTKDVNEGTGLSLSIGRGIIRDHGGDLSFDAKDPHTTFVVKLPITKS